MCRNIKTLHNFAPPASDDEVRASSLQFVRKLSGFTKPSKANEAAFNRAVDEVARAARELLDSLVTNAPPRDRGVEAAKARARSAERFRAGSAVAVGFALLLSGSHAWALAKKGPKISVGDDPSLKEGLPQLVLIEVSDFQ